MLRNRVEMSASIIFSVVMPEDATDEEIKAQALIDYKEAISVWPDKFILYCGLPDCRVYVSSDGDELTDAGIVDTEIIDEDDDEDC